MHELCDRCERQRRGGVEFVVQPIEKPKEELLRVLLRRPRELHRVDADELTEFSRRVQ